MFCIGGPARVPHVLAQTNLDPKGARPLSAPREPGRYRVFARGGASGSVEVEEGAPGEVRVTIEEAGIRPAEAHVAPGGSILVTNDTDRARHVKLERLGYASDAATAHYLSTVDDFRRLFSRDLLKRGTPLKVTRVTILFSDLTGSTALYSKIGDAAAFRVVDDHFDVIREIVVRHHGVVVKTMGDAVMAAFHDPRECVRASIDCLRGFDRFREKNEHGSLIGLKLGAVSGPCYVVNANAALDYFGQTVNVASRVQHLAGAGEVVVPQELFLALGDGERRELRIVERFEARVKGVDGPLDLVRLALPATRAQRLVEEQAGV
jgi:adenylate cyclase